MTVLRVRRPLRRFARDVDQALRGADGAANAEPAEETLASHLTIVLVFGPLYGAAMGGFGGLAGAQAWQIVFSAIKVPMLLLATVALSLPSFFVLNTLMGVRGDFPRVVRALLATQGGLTITLASLAPFTLFWYVNVREYHPAILFNGVMFGIASVAGQWLLARRYRPLIRRDPRHRVLLRAWLIIYVFVGIQMGWVLRPFVGRPDAVVRFFRKEGWGNAYLIVARMIWDTIVPR